MRLTMYNSRLFTIYSLPLTTRHWLPKQEKATWMDKEEIAAEKPDTFRFPAEAN